MWDKSLKWPPEFLWKESTKKLHLLNHLLHSWRLALLSGARSGVDRAQGWEEEWWCGGGSREVSMQGGRKSWNNRGVGVK